MLLESNNETTSQPTILTLIIQINVKNPVNNTLKIIIHLNLLTSTPFLWSSPYSSSTPLSPEVEPSAFFRSTEGKLLCS